MPSSIILDRFIKAQQKDYSMALEEVKHGQKKSHWMWYIFPQIYGLGLSEISRFYAIKDLKEAEAYLSHPVLGKRLLEISNELLSLKNDDAGSIFGSPDDLKLKSSMTLFSSLPNPHPVFESVLDKFFDGNKDSKTLNILAGQT